MNVSQGHAQYDLQKSNLSPDITDDPVTFVEYKNEGQKIGGFFPFSFFLFGQVALRREKQKVC